MSGWLRVIGLGPGAPDLLAPEAAAALDGASDLIGYGPYVARVPDRPGLTRHATDNRVEAGLGRTIRGLKVTAAELPDYVERVVRQYVGARTDGETFAEFAHRADEELLK